MKTTRRVLIADDNRDAADSLALCLKLSGHETHTAYDGVEAYEKVCSLTPDAVFVDLSMPKLDGYELTRRIRRDPRFNAVLLVALTGHADEKHRLLSDEVGFHFFVVKPADPVSVEILLSTRISGMTPNHPTQFGQQSSGDEIELPAAT